MRNKKKLFAFNCLERALIIVVIIPGDTLDTSLQSVLILRNLTNCS